MPNSRQLEFLQSLSEPQLTELVVIPLLRTMGFREIRYTHGVLECGKDLIFSIDDPIDKTQYRAAVIKQAALNGSVSSNRSVREVFFQLEQALKHPFIDPTTGQKRNIDRGYVITSFEISQIAANSIEEELASLSSKVQFIDGPSLLAHIDEHVPDLLESMPDPEARYLHALTKRFRDAPAFGSHMGAGSRTLADLYTAGHLSRIDLKNARLLSFATDEADSEQLDPLTTLLENKRLLLVADVGAGKTCMLRSLAARIAQDARDAQLIPVFVPLATADVGDGSLPDFWMMLEQRVQTEAGGDVSVDKNRFVLLLDGFDEYPADHDALSLVIAEIARECAGVVVTTRPSTIPGPNIAFQTYKVDAFSDDDIAYFVSKWCCDDSERAAFVVSQILNSETIRQFCRSPLMLTLCVILASRPNRPTLPSRRTEIYELIAGLLVHDWDEQRQVMSSFSRDDKFNALEILAYRTHSSRSRAFSPHQAIAAMAEVTGEDSAIYSAARRLFFEILFRSSLICAAGPALYEFAHLSFQEYFAARRLLRLDERTVRNLIGDGWWTNTFRFHFGLRRSMDSLRVTGAMRKKRGLGLDLASFLAEADFTSPGRRREILQLFVRDTFGSRSAEYKKICARLGNQLLDAIPARSEQAWHIVTLLAFINTNEARRWLYDHSSTLLEGSWTAQLKIIAAATKLLEGPSGTKWIRGAIGHLCSLGLTEHLSLEADEYASVRDDLNSIEKFLDRPDIAHRLKDKRAHQWSAYISQMRDQAKRASRGPPFMRR